MGNCEIDLYATEEDCDNSRSQQTYDQGDEDVCVPPMFQWDYYTVFGC